MVLAGRGFCEVHYKAMRAVEDQSVARLTSPTEKAKDCQQYDRAKQGHQNGRDRDGIIDRPNLEDRAEKVTSQICADNGHNDIDKQV